MLTPSAIVMAAFFLCSGASAAQGQTPEERPQEDPGLAPSEPNSGDADETRVSPEETPGDLTKSNGALLVFDRGALKLSMIGILQADAALWTGADNQLSDGDAAEHPGFRIARARVGWSARAFRFMVLKASMELGGGVERQAARVVDASIGYRHFPLLGFEMGIHKVPFSRFALTPAGHQALSSRPMAVQAMAPFRQVGFSLSGEIGGGMVRYAAGAYNGLERGAEFHQGYIGALDQGGNRDGPLALAARLSLAPRGSLGDDVADLDGGPLRIALSTSALRQRAENRTLVAWSVDLALKLHGFHFVGEYITDYQESLETLGDPPASPLVERLDRSALVGEAGYIFWGGRLGTAARVEWIDTNEAADDQGDALVFTGGLQHIWHRHHLKAHLEYTFREELHGARSDNQTVLLRLQARL